MITRDYQARPVKEFIDSIIVNIHMNYTDTIYGNRNLILDLIRNLGVKRYRDLLKFSHDAAHTAQRSLRDMGVFGHFVMDWDGRHNAGTPQQQIAALKDPRKVGGCAVLLEGENERDGDGVNADDVQRQTNLYKLVKADPALSKLPLLGPSWARGGASVPAWARTTGPQFEDGWNLHPYPGGRAPDMGGVTGQFGEPLGSIAQQVEQARGLVDQDVHFSETGYHNAVWSDGRGHWPTGEKAAGPYVPRLALEAFRLGVKSCAFYELIDQHPFKTGSDRESHFGLVRYNGTPKPAYVELQKLIKALNDEPGSQATTRNVKVTVDGDDDLRVLPLTRGDGSLALVLWRPISMQKAGMVNPTQYDDVPRTVEVKVDGYGSTGRVTVSGLARVFNLTRTGEVIPPVTEPTPEPQPEAGQIVLNVGTNDASVLTNVVQPSGTAVAPGTGSFASVRWGKSLTWSLDAPSGARVFIDLIETAGFAVGQRVFTVTAGGKTQTVDLVAAAGARTPTSIDLGEVPATDGKVVITVTGQVENAVVAGFRYVPLEVSNDQVQQLLQEVASLRQQVASLNSEVLSERAAREVLSAKVARAVEALS